MKKTILIICLLIILSMFGVLLTGCGGKKEKETTKETVTSIADKCRETINKLKTAQKGDIVEFGPDKYNTQYSKEDNSVMHSWRVLCRKGNKLLLLMDKACVPKYYMWTWPNEESEEKEMPEGIIAAYNSRRATSFFRDTVAGQAEFFGKTRISGTETLWTDYIISHRNSSSEYTDLFSLTPEQVKKYLPKKEDRILYPSEDYMGDEDRFEWWLGLYSWDYVDKNGKIKAFNTDDDYKKEHDRKAIRPAMWIDTSVEYESSNVIEDN